MNRSKLKPGTEVVLTDHPARDGWTNKAATYLSDAYWTAKVIDPTATYAGYENARHGYSRHATTKQVPGVKVEITGYTPGKYDDRDGPKPYKPGMVGNQPGSEGDGDTYLPGDTITVSARLIVNTTAENDRLIEAKRVARQIANAEAATKQATAEAIAARYEALGIEAKPLSTGTVKIETKPEVLIDIIEVLTMTLPPNNIETEEAYE